MADQGSELSPQFEPTYTGCIPQDICRMFMVISVMMIIMVMLMITVWTNIHWLHSTGYLHDHDGDVCDDDYYGDDDVDD